MFRIHIIIIGLMLVCGIGSLLWGTITSYKSKTRLITAAKSENYEPKDEAKSDKIEPKVTTVHANRKKEEPKVQHLNMFDLGEKSFPFSPEAVTIALWLQKNPSITITDWLSTPSRMHSNFSTSMTFSVVSSSSYSEPSSYRKKVSNLGSPIYDLPAGTVAIIMIEQTETEESRMSGSPGRRNPYEKRTKANRTSGASSSSSISGRSNSSSDDHGDSPSSGTRIKIGDEVEGEIHPEGDKDYFVFDGNAKEVINIDITAQRLGSDLDSYITLFGPDGSRLVEDDDSGYRFDSSISNFELPKTGKYKLEVSAFGNGGGPGQFYNLTVVNP